MEEGLASRLIQVGIRTLNQHQKQQAEKFSVEVNEMSTFDVTSFAPGVSHFEPGGLSVRDVLSIIQKINVPIIGADIVEYNPVNDINNMTAMVAVKLVKEIGGMMLATNHSSLNEQQSMEV